MVRLMPSSATEPFSAQNLAMSPGIPTVLTSATPSFVSDAIVPTASTCPSTKWPSSLPESASARSRFTEPPTRRVPSVVRDSVSRTAVKYKTFPREDSSVRHAPSTLTDAPGATEKPAMSGDTPSLIAGPSVRISRTVPVVSIIPVNTIYLLAGTPVITTSPPNVEISILSRYMHRESASGLSNASPSAPPPRILFANIRYTLFASPLSTKADASLPPPSMRTEGMFSSYAVFRNPRRLPFPSAAAVRQISTPLSSMCRERFRPPRTTRMLRDFFPAVLTK